jgi:hypothetical protein
LAEVAEVTFTVTVQDPFAGIVPPVNVKTPGLVVLGVAVGLPVGQDVEALGTAAFTKLAG